jgi:UrcA family protein
MVFKSTLLVCLAAASVTAFADTQPISNMQDSTALSFRHVNFSRPDEVAALYRNIRYAAERVCGPSNVPGFHFDSPKYAQCYDKAVNDAVTSVGRPELTAYYQEQVGNSRRLASQ